MPNLNGVAAGPELESCFSLIAGFGFFSEQQTHFGVVGSFSTMHVGHLHFLLADADTAEEEAGRGLGFFSEQQTHFASSALFSTMQVEHLHFFSVTLVALGAAGFGFFSPQHTQAGIVGSFSTMHVEHRHFDDKGFVRELRGGSVVLDSAVLLTLPTCDLAASGLKK